MQLREYIFLISVTLSSFLLAVFFNLIFHVFFWDEVKINMFDSLEVFAETYLVTLLIMLSVWYLYIRYHPEPDSVLPL